MSDAMITVVVKEPGVTARPVQVDPENMLDTLQGFVGGYIEALYLDGQFCLIVNEEGLLKNLPPNIEAFESKPTADGTYRGTVVMVWIEPTSDDFEGLPENRIKEAMYELNALALPPPARPACSHCDRP